MNKQQREQESARRIAELTAKGWAPDANNVWQPPPGEELPVPACGYYGRPFFG